MEVWIIINGSKTTQKKIYFSYFYLSLGKERPWELGEKKFYEKEGERLLYCENKVVLDFNVILFMTYYEELKGDTIIFWILGISKQVIRSFLTFLIYKIYVFANIYKIFSKKLKYYFKWFLDNHLRGDFFSLKKPLFFVLSYNLKNTIKTLILIHIKH